MKCIICGNHVGVKYEPSYVTLEDQNGGFPPREATYIGNAEDAALKGWKVIRETQTKVIVCGCNEGRGRAPNERP